jgi:dTDP-4-dehydrorhamnose 3,5-epimerase
MGTIKGVLQSPLRQIPGDAGNIMHVMKQHDESFSGFGEAYFSTVHPGLVKGWKRHKKMVLNLVVPVGVMKFVLYDDRPLSESFGQVQEIILSLENYLRLTVPPGVWMAFQGLGEYNNILLNIASIPHDPLESDNLPLQNDHIPYQGFL